MDLLAESVIYLDNAASTPIDPSVLAVMNRVAETLPANPSSVSHPAGRAAAACVEQARAQVACSIAAAADEIVWTSGATEANNLAIKGAANAWMGRTRKPGHIVSVCTEHRAVLDPLKALETEGWRITRLPVDGAGLIDKASLLRALTDDTALVSIMLVNNETGVIQDIPGLGEALRGRKFVFHVDAAQALGKLPIDVNALQVDLLSMSAHKLHGPQGVGALYRRRRPLTPVSALLHGGGQEQGIRAGTVATAQVAGMGAACALAAERMQNEQERIAMLRDQLWKRLSTLPGLYLNGEGADRVAGILNLSVEGVHPESLLEAICGGDDAVALSAGSACASGLGGSSYVLRAMGRSQSMAGSALRISLGRFTRADEIQRAARKISGEIGRLRDMLPPPVACSA